MNAEHTQRAAKRKTGPAEPKRERSTNGNRRKVPADSDAAARAERRVKVGAIAAALRDVVREQGLDVLDIMKAWVEDAAARGWFVVNEHGWACVKEPDISVTDDADESERQVEDHRPSSAIEHGELYTAIFGDTPTMPDSELAHVMAKTPLIRHADRVDRAEERALSALLGIPSVQHAALRALGVEMVEPGHLEVREAMRISYDLGMVASGTGIGVPEAMLDRVLPFLSKLHDWNTPTWEAALILAVGSAVMQRHLDARAKVHHVLEMLRLFTTEGLHPNLLSPTEDHINKATRLMQTVRHGDVREEARPRHAREGRGRPVSSRGAAAAFADCFQVRMERKDSRVRRRKN